MSTLRKLTCVLGASAVAALVAGCGVGGSKELPAAAVAGSGGSGGGGGGATTTTAASTYLVYIPNTGNVAPTANSPSIGDGALITTGTNTLLIRPNSATLAGVTNYPDTGTMALIGSSGGVTDYANASSSARVYTAVGNGFGGTQNLTDASFGVFSTAYNASELIAGGFHTGNGTAFASVPNTGTATYRGTFTGLAYTEGGAATATNLTGVATVNADFGASTVNGQISSLTRNGTPTGVNLNFNAGILGNSYLGGVTSVTNAGTGAPAGTTIVSSHVNGGFYGATAGETAGNIGLRTSSNPGLTSGPAASGVSVVGAYGARR